MPFAGVGWGGGEIGTAVSKPGDLTFVLSIVTLPSVVNQAFKVDWPLAFLKNTFFNSSRSVVTVSYVLLEKLKTPLRLQVAFHAIT